MAPAEGRLLRIFTVDQVIADGLLLLDHITKGVYTSQFVDLASRYVFWPASQGVRAPRPGRLARIRSSTSLEHRPAAWPRLVIGCRPAEKASLILEPTSLAPPSSPSATICDDDLGRPAFTRMLDAFFKGVRFQAVPPFGPARNTDWMAIPAQVASPYLNKEDAVVESAVSRIFINGVEGVFTAVSRCKSVPYRYITPVIARAPTVGNTVFLEDQRTGECSGVPASQHNAVNAQILSCS